MVNNQEVLGARIRAIAECRQFLDDLSAAALAAEQEGREDAEGAGRTCEEGDGKGCGN